MSPHTGFLHLVWSLHCPRARLRLVEIGRTLERSGLAPQPRGAGRHRWLLKALKITRIP
jgi:hypothetical protein